MQEEVAAETPLQASGYRVHLVCLSLPSPELALGRVAERVRLGGHAIPEEVVRRRFVSGLRNFFTLYQGIANSWEMFDNSDVCGLRLIASGGTNQALDIQDPGAWNNLQEQAR